MTQKILLIDDDPYTRQLFEGLLSRSDSELTTAADLASGRAAFNAAEFSLVILDQRLPDGNGLDYFRGIREQRPQQLVILITGYAEVRDAVRAVKDGLFDYLTKPFENLDELTGTIDRALEMDRACRQISDLRALQTHPDQPLIVGRSPPMRKLLCSIQQLAPLDTTLLIEGETGTGKELVARQVHALSARAKRPFVALNCSALSESLLETTLFGYEKPSSSTTDGIAGAFEDVNGGTLLLDSVADLSAKLQTRLIRVLQDRTFARLGSAVTRKSDFRLICTSNRSLEDEVSAGRFRTDLYYRINVNLLQIPPLRKRREDILPMALLFLERFNREFGKSAGPFTPDAVAAMEKCIWSGNARQVQHAVERAVVANLGRPISKADLGLAGESRAVADRDVAPSLTLQQARERFEREYLVDLLHAVDGNISEAARRAKISRQALYRHLKELGIVAND